MHLLERSSELESLTKSYYRVEQGFGHTVVIRGEAGIGKTSLVEHFIQNNRDRSEVYIGACDSLFTPRPLGPLYDICYQLGDGFAGVMFGNGGQTAIFATLKRILEQKTNPVILVFEDIQWADEATMDLIKFLVRRIIRLRCLLILTVRDDELPIDHPLYQVLGDFPANSSSNISMSRLSCDTVMQMADEYGLPGNEIFDITNGNPYYVKELLENYHEGIPKSVKEAVLSVFNRQKGPVKDLWETISILPGRVETWLVSEIQPDYLKIIDTCLNARILVSDGRFLHFKHDLFRRTIEDALNPVRKLLLHQKILKVMLQNQEKGISLSRLVHHAKNAHDDKLIRDLAPRAAEEAAILGAHMEASTLFRVALEQEKTSSGNVAHLLEKYAYECYLTNQMDQAIQARKQALEIWLDEGDPVKTGDCQRWLSRLFWFLGKREESGQFAEQALQTFTGLPVSSEKAMAFSNMSQLKMLESNLDEAIAWGNKAIEMAEKLGDTEILSHALNNVGTALMFDEQTFGEGYQHLANSLTLALQNEYHEHAARAYTNLGSCLSITHQFDDALKRLNDGIAYCEERNLDSWTYYQLSWKALTYLKTGYWSLAESIAQKLMAHKSLPPIVSIGALVVIGLIRARKGDPEAKVFLKQAWNLAQPTREIQRIIPASIALAEWYWLTNQHDSGLSILLQSNELAVTAGVSWYREELNFWLWMFGQNQILAQKPGKLAPFLLREDWSGAADYLEKMQLPYEVAWVLAEGEEESQRKALSTFQQMEAEGAILKLQQKMRSRGVRSIPKGPHQSTRKNPAGLTNRQLEVLTLLSQGLQNNEIASQLYLSVKTIDHHISAILSKLEADSRTKAVARARELGIITN
jgi:DNA-binding CsgD family transcriptional regulator/tetratricopeptide (TPR) repeat protein/GTPase SAR1 family protein